MERRAETSKGNPSDELLRQGVHDLGELFGIQGFDVVVRPGAGWSCAKTPNGLTITVDPHQLTEKWHKESDTHTESTGHSAPDPRYIVYGSGHEIGHGKDFIDPEWRELPKEGSEHFFWNVIDDTVINKRLRRVPMLDEITDELYGDILFPSDDITENPKHVQFMYGALLGTVTTNPLPKMSEEVADKLRELTQFEADEQIFDIFKVLSDPRTSLKQRRSIARKFVLPIYKDLLKQDKKDGKNKKGDKNQQSGEQPDGQPDFQDHYDKYEETVHGHSHEDQSGGDANGQQETSEEGKPGDESQDQANQHDHARQIADILVADESDEENEAQASLPDHQAEDDSAHETTLSNLAGTIAKEMQIDLGDAREYVESLDRWRHTINEVAAVLLKLAAPSTAIMSPRYADRTANEGERLHPRRLVPAAIQLATGREEAIWQPVERRAHRQEMSFGGLDIYLAGDISGSMQDDGKALCAASSGQILLEGVQLARAIAKSSDNQLSQPDVRTEGIVFGSGTNVVAPLTHQPSEPEKGKLFCNLLRPKSRSTLVSGTLEEVRSRSLEFPDREHILAIISDGEFGDYDQARQQVASMPDNVYVAHLVIGNDVSEFISPNNQKVPNPQDLPQSLRDVLASRIRDMQAT